VTTRWAYLDHPGPIPFAHRGGASDMPENTMPAFEWAVKLGYKYLETDVHVTADGVLVAFHDDVLDRVTDRTGAIAALSWDEVGKARVSGEPIPLLEDVLGTWPEVRVNIDAKHDASVEPLVEVLGRTSSLDRVCVGAFADRRLSRFRRLTDGRVCTSMGPLEIARLRAASFHVPSGRLGGACTQVPVRYGAVLVVDHRFVETAHRRNVPVHIWTVDEPGEMDRLLDLGVDGIMSDRPAVLKEVLTRRGQWF
jgi:glycerophosphoryl diester phosphodiesterase